MTPRLFFFPLHERILDTPALHGSVAVFEGGSVTYARHITELAHVRYVHDESAE